jgi:putative ABC transport system permease protein
MKWLIELAARNLRRNTRRTVLAVTSIAIAVMLVVFMGGFIMGVLDNLVTNLTKSDMGHVRISSRGFADRAEFLPLDDLVADPAAAIAAIEAIPELKDQLVSATPRIRFGTMLSSGPSTITALGFAGDIEAERSLLGLAKSISDGRYLAGGGEALLGATAAADLGLKVGDVLRVVTQGSDFGLHLKRFAIVGLFKTGLSEMDGSMFQIPIADAMELLRTGGGVQQIQVMLKDYNKAGEAAALIRAALAKLDGGADLAVQPWTEIGTYPGLIEQMKGMYVFIVLLISFLGAFIISNILMMVVLERRREIGIMKALGLRRRDILFLFIGEGAAMGVIGSAIGSVLGLLMCWYFSVNGLDFSAAMSTLSMPFDPYFRSRVDFLLTFEMFLVGVAVSIAVSILPSRRAALMNPVDAMKSVA